MFALFTKHRGFAEEDEWRIVYLMDRDPDKRAQSMFHHLAGARGIEPKLRFKIAPVAGLTADDLSLQKIIKRIIGSRHLIANGQSSGFADAGYSQTAGAKAEGSSVLDTVPRNNP